MLDRGLRAGAGAAVVAADQHHVGFAFGHAGGHRADADFGHQLDADARVAVGVFQIVDQLRQIFDRIDIVMRRRRDQTHARRAVANAGDFLVDLVAGQLAAFARLGALGHFDLQFLGADQVFAGHAEAAAGHLLDGAGAQIAVGVGRVADRDLRPLRPCCSCRRCDSWRWPASRALLCEIEPYDMAPVANRLTISSAGSTSSSGIGCRVFLEFQQAAQREQLPSAVRRSVGRTC